MPRAAECPVCRGLVGAEAGSATRCASCGETLYRREGGLIPHRIATAVLPMWVVADRLRNHLRRLAIVRVGRIEGDCYFLPFVRMEGGDPEGDGPEMLLAASIGEERIERVCLPAADLRPFEPPEAGAAGRSGDAPATVRILWPTLPKHALAARVERQGWSPSREVELVHFPFWLMRAEDRGRIEGVWMDGIEGRLIHHRIRLTPPLPSRGDLAILTALPAAAALAAGAVAPPLAMPAAAMAWALSVPLAHSALLRRWRG